MKKQKHTLIILSLFIAVAMMFGYCKKPDQEVAQPTPTPVNNTPVTYPGNQLTAIYTGQTGISTPSFAITSDWTTDVQWKNAPELSCATVVPNTGQTLFQGYIGKTYDVTMKAMYDSTYIYFLLQYSDLKQSMATPWYFDTTGTAIGKPTGWVKEASSISYDANGVMSRSAFQEDKLGVLWNINNSCEAFKTQTCYGTCHVFQPYYNRAGQPKANTSGNHYTTYANEKIDMWHFRLTKDAAYGKGSDEYQDFVGGAGNWDTTGGSANGRHVDGISPTTAGGTTYSTATAVQGANSQNLKPIGKSTAIAVPMWYILDPSTYVGGQFYIDVKDTMTANANVVCVQYVDTMGNLYCAKTRSGSVSDTIRPNSANYLRGAMTSENYYNVETTPTEGKYCQPASFATPVATGTGRDDVDMSSRWVGGKCIIQIRRKLTTNDMMKQDVDFKGYHPAGDPLPTTPSSSGVWFQDQPFGIGIFNNANYQHAIKPNLLLHFKTN